MNWSEIKLIIELLHDLTNIDVIGEDLQAMYFLILIYGKITYTNTIYLNIENGKCEERPIYRILVVIFMWKCENISFIRPKLTNIS